MVDTRELILARLKDVLSETQGVVAVGRNQLDAAGLPRPFIILHDGGESVIDRAGGNTATQRAYKFSAVQWMVLEPEVELRLLLEDADSGPKLSLYRRRIILAALNDATLRSLVGPNGNIAYRSFGVDRPRPEERERRADLGFEFTYPFGLSDLAGG